MLSAFMIERIRNARAVADIVAIIRRTTSLVQGIRPQTRWSGMCPFCRSAPHPDAGHKANLAVDARLRLWHCWGCKKGGDVLVFIMFRDGHEDLERAILAVEAEAALSTSPPSS